MKRSELKRKTPLIAKTPMARGQSRMRKSKPKADKPKRAERNDDPNGYLAACHDQRCYLAIHGTCNHDRGTVVPCHSNQARHGKGMGIKARHEFTVPGCSACHMELDQGYRFDKEQKFAIWDDAYESWKTNRKIQSIE